MARISLTVAPGAQRAGVVGRHGDGWKVRVAAAPERGRANEAVLELVADVLGVRRSDLALVSGHASRHKVVAVSGLSDADAAERLAGAPGRRRRPG
jgi:uncharacterized protein